VTFNLDFAAASDAGRVRSHNEDRWAAHPDDGLFLVADGLGGHRAGALASRVVAEGFPKLLLARAAALPPGDIDALAERVLESIRELSNDLCAQASDEPGLEGMGATLVVLLVRGDQAIVAHLGDCRAYLLRDRELRQLTRDHTLVQLLLDRQAIEAAEAAAHPSRGQVTRYVGMPHMPLPEIRRLQLQAHDRILLCSDGLTGMVADDQIKGLLMDEPHLDACCRRLLAAANAAGGTDNITAVVVDILHSTPV
jgi:protein phosphatase